MKPLSMNMLMHGLLWLMLMAATPIYADNPTGPVLPVQEKVYLHFDNNCYFQGDTIWYKAYVVLADDNSPEPLSRILYTELLNEQGYLMERQQLVVDEHGQADGCFAVSDTAFAGYYEVRAYTKWMLNFGFEVIPSWNSRNLSAVNRESILNEQEDVPNVINRSNLDRGWVKYDEKGNPIYFDNEYDSGFNIDEDVMSTNYRLYNNLFSRVLPIYNRPDSAQNYMRRIIPAKITVGDYEVRWKTPDFDMHFYPESGILIDGMPCRVAWEAVNQQLERLNITALLEEDGVVVDTLRAIHAGRGLFTFTPHRDKKYRVIYSTGDKDFTFRLPNIEREGGRIIVEQDDEAVYFDVAQRFTIPHQLHLSIFCRGKQISTYTIDKTPRWATAMYLDDLPEGVNQVVLHDTLGTVFADRLFFVNKLYESKGKIMVAGMANRPYQPLEKIHLNLLATDAKGKPLANQIMSVSVRDAAQLDPSFATGNIMTNLLLESEIKGFVETPDYYFEANDQRHRQALDLLLMVQGWRRYDWHDITHPEEANLRYLPEQKMILYGEAKALRKQLFKKGERKLQIACSILNMNDDLKKGDYYKFKGVVEADSNGRFSFAYDPFYGNVILALRAKFVDKIEKNKKKYDMLTHDPQIFLRKQYYYPLGLKQYSWYETNSPDSVKDKKVTWEDITADIYASEWIPQVTIKAPRRAHALRNRNKPVFTIPVIDFVNDMWDLGYYNTFDLLDYRETSLGAITGLFHSFSTLQYTTSINNEELAWVEVDGHGEEGVVKINNDFLPILRNLSIVTDAPRRPTAYEHYHQDRREDGTRTYGIDRIIMVSTYPNDSTHIIRGREYNFQGFTRPVEYYNPDYSHASLPEIHDYRRTLYWNPNVTTDRYGQASIEFYNNSVCTLLDVSAEGISKYGQFLVNDE